MTNELVSGQFLVFVCIGVYSKIQNYVEMYRDVKKCTAMYRNVQDCTGMYRNV